MRQSYTAKEKLVALNKLVQNNNNISKTAREVGVSNKIILGWKKNENKILTAKNKNNTKFIGCGQGPAYSDIKKCFHGYLKKGRRINRLSHIAH